MALATIEKCLLQRAYKALDKNVFLQSERLRENVRKNANGGKKNKKKSLVRQNKKKLYMLV